MRGGPAAGLITAIGVGWVSLCAGQDRGALSAVDRYVGDEIRREHVPGVSVAIVRGGRVVLARGYGQANVELHVPATDSTVYQSGSVGKQFTAALILRLAAAGRLGLDDPIRRHLPEGPPSWDSITVRHLLTHTSGIAEYTDSAVDFRRDYTEDELVRVASRLPPLFRPGDRWSYSNTGYLLLGAIVHRVTGVFYGDLLRDEIFRPLGMGESSPGSKPQAASITSAEVVHRRVGRGTPDAKATVVPPGGSGLTSYHTRWSGPAGRDTPGQALSSCEAG